MYEANNKVVVVTTSGDAIGSAEKYQAHVNGVLHLAFSVVIIRGAGEATELMLQKRAKNKYHTANLWSNTCCSHPFPREEMETAIQRRLGEELGIHQPLQFTKLAELSYRLPLENGMTEHEYNHIYCCENVIESIALNPQEVADIRWERISNIKDDLKTHPHRYTPWFKYVLTALCESLAHKKLTATTG